MMFFLSNNSRISFYDNNNFYYYIKRTILLKYLKIELDTNPKIILLDYQNNYPRR